MNHKRIRDWGICIGEMTPGPRNKLTDVPGVRVGHATLDDTYHKTGVTVILPAPGNLFADKLTAAAHVINGFGKTAGSIQLDELGTLETPIALCSTLNVGRISDALVGYTLAQCAADGIPCRSVNPVVGETNDSVLNRVEDRPLGEAHLQEALANAALDFDEGDVGAGKGTRCMSLKGGIGSASRTFSLDGQTYTVGALVQSNFGRLPDLRIDGYPAGQVIARMQEQASDRASGETRDWGSCMIILGTDVPLSQAQLTRVLRRAEVGLVRVGSYIGHGSGDVVLGFTTANRIPHDAGVLIPQVILHNDCMDQVFRAAAESVEEALLNSLCTADSVDGYLNGETPIHVPSLAEYLPVCIESILAAHTTTPTGTVGRSQAAETAVETAAVETAVRASSKGAIAPGDL